MNSLTKAEESSTFLNENELDTKVDGKVEVNKEHNIIAPIAWIILFSDTLHTFIGKLVSWLVLFQMLINL